MKFRVLSIIGVLLFAGLLFLTGNPGLLLNAEPTAIFNEQSIWLPADPADWTPQGRDVVKNRVLEIKDKLDSLSGPLTDSLKKEIRDFFKHRDWITDMEGDPLNANSIYGYLNSSACQNVTEIKFELAWFIAEEVSQNVTLPFSAQQADDILHYMQYGFKLTWTIDNQDGTFTVIDPPGTRDERHIRSCDWIQ